MTVSHNTCVSYDVVDFDYSMFRIFHKMDDISARKSKGRETVALSNDESIAICKPHHRNSNSRVVLQNARHLLLSYEDLLLFFVWSVNSTCLSGGLLIE